MFETNSNISTKRRKLNEFNDKMITKMHSNFTNYAHHEQDSRESKLIYFQKGSWMINEKLQSYSSGQPYNVYYGQYKDSQYNLYNVYHNDQLNYSDSFYDINSTSDFCASSSQESLQYSGLEFRQDLNQEELNLVEETVFDIPKLIHPDTPSVSHEISSKTRKLQNKNRKMHFFHPYLWTKEEVQLFEILFDIYGKDWNIISKRICGIKSSNLIEYEYYKNQETGYIYFVNFKRLKCYKCSEIGDPTILLCYTCKKVYHNRCLNYEKTEGYKQFCSIECYNSNSSSEISSKHWIYPLNLWRHNKTKNYNVNCNHNLIYNSIISSKRKCTLNISSNVTWNLFKDLSKLCLECLFIRDCGIIPSDLSIINDENHPLNNIVKTPIFLDMIKFKFEGTLIKRKKELEIHFTKFLKNIYESLNKCYYDMCNDNDIDWEEVYISQNIQINESENDITKTVDQNSMNDTNRRLTEKLDDNDILTSSNKTCIEDTTSVKSKSSEADDSRDEELINEEFKEDVKYWIFQANPKYYDIRNSLLKVKSMTWFVKQHISSIKENHKVFIWVSGKEAGIIAVGTVTIGPRPMEEEPAMKEFFISPIFNGIKQRCRIRIDCVLPSIIPKEYFLKHPLYRDLVILRAPIGTNFKVFESQGKHLYETINEFLKTNKLPDVNACKSITTLRYSQNESINKSRCRDNRSNNDVLNCEISNSESYTRYICKFCKNEFQFKVLSYLILSKERFICRECYISQSKFTKVILLIGLREIRRELYQIINNRCEYIEKELNDILNSYDENQWYEVVKKLVELTDRLKRDKNMITETAERAFSVWMKKLIKD